MASFSVPPLPHSPHPNSAPGNCVCTSHSHIFHVLIPRILCAVGWGVAWEPSSGLSSKQRNMDFWWFLHSYMTSGPFYCWYFLLLKLRIFLCYLSLQVTDILYCVAKNSLRGTPPYFQADPWTFHREKGRRSTSFLVPRNNMGENSM